MNAVTRISAGLFAVLVTPFTATGALDEAGLGALVDFYVDRGASGLVVASVMGEAASLDEGERLRVVEIAVARARRRVPVIAGVVDDDPARAPRAASQVAELGADGLLVAPPRIVPAGNDSIVSHFRAVAAAAPLPIVILDNPAVTGVALSIPLLVRLAGEIEAISAVKLEAPPTAAKIAGLRTQVGARLRIFGGLGGLYCWHELVRGADGMMTGYAFPEHLLAILTAIRAGQVDMAAEAYMRALPLLVHEAQPAIGIALRKDVLTQRGVLACAAVRPPTPALDDDARAEVGRVLMARWSHRGA